jgi:hypothetical protein
MIVLYSTPYIQVVLNSSFSIMIWYYMLIFNPYVSKLDRYMSLYIEFITFLILSIIVSFTYEDLASDLYDIAEWSIIILIYLSIMVPNLVNLVITIKYFIDWLKVRYRKRHVRSTINTISKYQITFR